MWRHRAFKFWAIAGLLLIFAVLALDYLSSDFWFDEVITLTDYIWGPRRSLGFLFRNYRVANNHILYTALLWGWAQLTGLIGNEPVMRLPGLLMALATGLLLYHQGRRLLGPAEGFFLALLMMLSPVYLNYFAQLRGYGLTILLSTVATIGALYLANGETRRGFAFYVPAVGLLPGVLPSNLVFNLALVLFIALSLRRSWARHLGTLLLAAAAAVAGMAIYLPIWPQFLKVSSETQGWDSGWLVAGHWLAALGAHAGVFVLASLALARQPEVAATEPEDRPTSVRARLRLLLACTMPVLLLAALVRAPYPRALLAFLAPATFGALVAFRPGLCRQNRNFYLLVFFVVANVLVWTRVGAWMTERQLLTSDHVPQNLLWQYYCRNRDVGTTARYLAAQPWLAPSTRMFVDFHFYTSMALYWQGSRRPGDWPTSDQVECLYPGEPQAPFKPKLPQEWYRRVPLLVITYQPVRALPLLRQATGLDAELIPLQSPTALGIYQVVPRGPRPRGSLPGPQPPGVPTVPQPPGGMDI